MSHYIPIAIGLVVLLALPIYLFFALYFYAPLVTRKQQIKELMPIYVPIELTSLPSDFSGPFIEASRQLESRGFVCSGLVSQKIKQTNQLSYVAIYTNPLLRDRAQIIGIFTPSQHAKIRIIKLVTFLTEFEDGTSIVTSNTASPSCFPVDRAVSAVRCAGIQDLEVLYKFHRARVDHDGGSRNPSLDNVKDPASRMQFEHQKTFNRLTKVGYYVRDDIGLCYFPTYKGAFLMTYRLLPPLKQIQMSQKRRAADRALRELGFGGSEQFRKSQSVSAGD